MGYFNCKARPGGLCCVGISGYGCGRSLLHGCTRPPPSLPLRLEAEAGPGEHNFAGLVGVIVVDFYVIKTTNLISTSDS